MRQLQAPKDQQSGEGVLLALDAASGQVRWQRELAGATGLGGAVSAGDLAFLSTPPSAVRLSDGEPRWNSPVQGNPMGGPALAPDGQTVFIGLADPKTSAGRIVALSVADGTPRWEAPLPASTLHPLERPWPSGDTLVVPLWDGGIAGLVARTGALRWHHQPAASRLGGITVEKGRVWFMQQNLAVIGLDAATGEPAFRFALDVDLSSMKVFAPRPAVIGGRLLAPMTLMLLGLELPP
jgi:outer membrane protein assembly factor BamB